MSPADEKDKSVDNQKDDETKEIEEVPTTAPPLTVPIEDPTFEEHTGRRWLMLFVYFVLALAVAILVVFGGRFVYRAITDNKPATQPAGDQTPQQPGNTPPTTPQPASAPAPAPTSAPSQPTTQPTQLPNNGPGAVLAIFVGTAIVVSGLHYLYNLRRQY